MLQVPSNQKYLRLNGRLTTDFPQTTVPDWLNSVQRTQILLGSIQPIQIILHSYLSNHKIFYVCYVKLAADIYIYIQPLLPCPWNKSLCLFNA